MPPRIWKLASTPGTGPGPKSPNRSTCAADDFEPGRKHDRAILDAASTAASKPTSPWRIAVIAWFLGTATM